MQGIVVAVQQVVGKVEFLQGLVWLQCTNYKQREDQQNITDIIALNTVNKMLYINIYILYII